MIYDYLNITCRRLAIWGLVTLVAGVWMWLDPQPSFRRGLGMQLAVWGAVCLVIALPALVVSGLRRRMPSSPELERRQEWMLRVAFWFSVAIDLVLVAAGLWLLLTAGLAERFQAGSGWGALIHGVFLVLFDSLHALGVPRPFAMPEIDLFSDPVNEDFTLAGGEPAVLLLHGYPGTPAETVDIGKAFQAAGWTVRGLLLPGFGAGVGSLVYRRSDEWVAAVVDTLREMKQEHFRVVVAGFSMGGSVAMAAAERAAPDALVLMSPFVWNEPGWKWLLIELGRTFLPTSVRPFGWVDFSREEIRRELEKVQPGVDVEGLAKRKDVRKMRVPLLALEQLRDIGKQAWRAAPNIQAPTFIVQGSRDKLSSPARTRRLAKRIPGCVEYREVDAPHHMTTLGSDGYEAFIEVVMAYAERIKSGKLAESQPEINQPPQ